MLILLLRQHVSDFALGHHQVATCIRRRILQCVYIATNIYGDLVDNMIIDCCRSKQV